MLINGLITRQTSSVVQDSCNIQLVFFKLMDTVSIGPEHEMKCGLFSCIFYLIRQRSGYEGKWLRQICRASVRDVIST